MIKKISSYSLAGKLKEVGDEYNPSGESSSSLHRQTNHLHLEENFGEKKFIINPIIQLDWFFLKY